MSVRQQYKTQLPSTGHMASLLKRTNDYTIYSHFLGRELEFRELVKSPLRDDQDPTFNIFPAKVPRWEGQILFKDFNGETGNVFKFVEKLGFYKYNILLQDIEQIIQFIVHVMDLDGVSSVHRIEKPIIPDEATSKNFKLKHLKKWTKNHLEYWAEYGVNEQLLNVYRIMPVEYLLNEREQIVANFNRTTTFAYWIFDRFKLYQPYEENFKKFFNQCPAWYIQGYEQCFQNTGHLVITKSAKDVVVIQAHNTTGVWQDIIAPHGEGYIFTDEMLYWVLSNYRKVTILFDPDYTGVRGARRLRTQLRTSRFYSGHQINVQFVTTKRVLKRGKWVAPVKDLSDYRLIYGKEMTELKLQKLLA